MECTAFVDLLIVQSSDLLIGKFLWAGLLAKAFVRWRWGCDERLGLHAGARNTAIGTFAATMEENSPCPECRSAITYPTGTSWMCGSCGHEWSPEEIAQAEADRGVKDANGNLLKDGDDVVVIKDLPVKGAPKPVKAGTKVKNIRLVDGDHDIDCKIDGFGAMGLKSIYVRKA